MDMEHQMQDHENRIRKLEESDIRQQIQLANIEKSQAEIKVMINETSKEQTKNMNEKMDKQQNTMNDMVTKILETFTNGERTNQEKRFYETKQFWGFIMALVAIASSVITYFLK
ncbi:hypothetical protein [Clostridium sporogenes]|uniref:hypothetical protein n=1 Tax=Clostridium sporogenes TaxID=1509 RepID=UPI0013CFCDF5|nr:hypothetical protein [Clostridium sporogenes]NFF79165.1 hypothetical protein [Clostridium sporogenes]NFH40651.1 hypothetical protein [Clostridium sporogenes]